ncbi:MAG: hypothetical protein JNN20_04860 [Betaproteobacteria bacterium]|nr:hypothetical protein [Betaproteobacteria bacterium]
MSQKHVPAELAKVALSLVQGADFEEFSKVLVASTEGHTFSPLGGNKDGGADGFSRSDYLNSAAADSFFQFSIQDDFRSKIRSTVTRLKEFGRTPARLTYVTSQIVKYIDKEEDALSSELGLTVRIRDLGYLLAHVNESTNTIGAFHSHLARYTDYLKHVGAAAIVRASTHASDPSVYVFLQQEVDNRLGNSDLLKTITDGLILWALSETDPDKELLMTRMEILQRIEGTVPWARHFIRAELDHRLQILTSKGNATGREVSWYRKQDKFCLPFKTRQIVQQENLRDESLRLDVLAELVEILKSTANAKDIDLHLAANTAIRTIEFFFEKEGLSFSHFLKKSDSERTEPNTITDRIDDAINDTTIPPDSRQPYRMAIREALTKVFYGSTERQREFLFQMSRTYVLLFTLQAEPKIIEYFQGMTANFMLYVGSDILIRALSERYVPEPDQMTRNMLRMASHAGVNLILTEPVLEEIYTHLKATNFEFINHFSEIEPHVSREIARHSSKILIRTYFYAKESKQVPGWKAFLGQFLSYEKIQSDTGISELGTYLTTQFGLSYVSKEEIEATVNVTKVKQLAQTLIEQGEKKFKEELAYNDALMIYGIYGMRKKHQEVLKGNEFGLASWWLTQETRIQRYTVNLVIEQGARYIMRPEFLLNYFAMSPSKVDVLNTFKGVFPTVLGLQMGHRMRDEAYHQVLEKVTEFHTLEHGRRTAKMQQLSDNLKADSRRIYNNNFSKVDELFDRPYC